MGAIYQWPFIYLWRHLQAATIYYPLQLNECNIASRNLMLSLGWAATINSFPPVGELAATIK